MYCAGILQYLVDCRCFTPKALECIQSVVDFEIRCNGETGGEAQANVATEGTRSTETGGGGQAAAHDRCTPPGATPPVGQSGSNSEGAAEGGANRDESMEQVNTKRKRQEAGDELMNDSDVSGRRGHVASSSADDKTKDLCRWFAQCNNPETPVHRCFRCNLFFHNLCRQRNETCSDDSEMRNELSYYCGCTSSRESLSQVAEAFGRGSSS